MSTAGGRKRQISRSHMLNRGSSSGLSGNRQTRTVCIQILLSTVVPKRVSVCLLPYDDVIIYIFIRYYIDVPTAVAPRGNSILYYNIIVPARATKKYTVYNNVVFFFFVDNF